MIAATRSNRLFILIAFCIAILICIAGSVWLYNDIELQQPFNKVVLAENRNQVVKAKVHFDNWVDTHTVVYDLVDLAGSASGLDVFRVFLQYAKAQQSSRFNKIVLASNGRAKFVVQGDYFQELGKTYSSENPMYLVRTFAHHVFAMDGTKPFPEVYGGVLYVLPTELEQFKNLNQKWYLDDYLARHKNG